MNIFKVALDTRHQNGVIGTVTQFDNAVLELQILSDGVIDEAWGQPQFELIAMKRDANPVREVDQDRFTILSKEEHRVQIELKEQFLTCRGTVKMQLVVKDGSRLSTTLFYLVIGQSLDHDIVESHRDVKVLDDLEAYVKQGFDDLSYQEQRMVAVEQSTNDLNETMNANEAERNVAETKRSQIFETNETNRTQMLNTQVEKQRIAFSNAQTQREKDFSESQQNMSQAFETSQRERESAFNKAQELNQTTFTNNETKRQTAFNQSQTANQQDFVDNEAERQRLFESNESDRQVSESQRVQNESERVQAESQRADAEVIRQQKMTEFEEKATQLSNDLDTQVARVDEFVTANEKKLLGLNDKKDYMGNSHDSVKEVMDANVDWLLGEINTVHYEGQHITATDSIEGRSKSAILTGHTLINLIDSTQNMEFAKSGAEAKEVYTINNISPRKLNVTVNSKPNYWNYVSVKIKLSLLKPNTRYLVKAKNLSNITGLQIAKGDGTGKLAVQKSFIDNSYAIITTNDLSELSEGQILYVVATNFKNDDAITYPTTISLEDTMLIEYQDGMENWDIPYFEGMQSVKLPVLKTIGKNLWCSNYTIGKFIDDNGDVADSSNIHVALEDFIPIRGGADVIFSNSITIHGVKIYEYDNNKKFICSTFSDLLKKLNDNTKYYRYRAALGGIGSSTIEALEVMMFEYGTQATTYEPYKTNILTVNEEVELRGIGDVKDELDCLTGEVVERIKEVVLNGSENWVARSGGTSYAYFINNFFDYNNVEGITSSFKFIKGGAMSTQTQESICSATTQTALSLFTNKDELSTVENLKSYLSQNPVTIQYPIATESIKTVDLSEYHVYSYKDVTHYDCSSAEGSLVPTLSIDVPTNLPAVVTRQRATIQELEKENVALKNEIVETAKSSVSGDLELMSSQFELDFRLFEIEMNLDMPMMAMMKGAKSMAMTVYQQAKTLILAGKYDREDMEYKLGRYKDGKRITQDEYDELIALMNAHDLMI